jgi:hypothetical protein
MELVDAELFHLPEITYWQAIGIFLLARLIFGFGEAGSKETSPGSKKSSSDNDVQREADTKSYSKWRQWEYYDEWWEQDGKKAFNKYLNNKRESGSNSDNCSIDKEDGNEDSEHE